MATKELNEQMKKAKEAFFESIKKDPAYFENMRNDEIYMLAFNEGIMYSSRILLIEAQKKNKEVLAALGYA